VRRAREDKEDKNRRREKRQCARGSGSVHAGMVASKAASCQ
jgi:hypothetical protein